MLAHLHLEYLASEYNINGFKGKLGNLCTTPDEVYTAALERIGHQSERYRSLAMNTLGWLVFAERELTVAELIHALDIQDNMFILQNGSMTLPTGNSSPNHESALTSACVGIVVVDQTTKVVRLAHNTAERFLKKEASIFENMQSKIANTCLYCLLHIPLAEASKATLPKVELEQRCSKFPLLKYASDHWGDHLSFKVEGSVYRLAWRFLSDKRKVSSTVHVMVNFQLRHEREVSGLHLLAYFGLVKMVKKARDNGVPLSLNSRTYRGETPLHWAVLHRQYSFLRFLIDQNADPNIPDKNGKTSLHKAIYNGDQDSIQILLSSKTQVDLTVQDGQGWTPLRWAAAYGRLPVVEKLLDKGADVDARDKDQWTAIRWAAQNGHEVVVESLLKHNASSESPDSKEWTLLRWSAKEGLDHFIRLLIEKGVDLDVTDAQGLTALQWAVTYGHTMAVWHLLQAGADTNKPDEQGNTPLHTALEKCPASSLTSILCLILEKRIKINAKTKKMQLRPLHMAAARGSHSAVWLLIEKDAASSLYDVNNRSALHFAVEGGHYKVAQLLCWKFHSLIDIGDAEKRTALHYAASLGHLHIVELLLDNRADINSCDFEGNTPLHLAVCQEQEQVVIGLIRRGADLNKPNKKMKKRMLRLASESGNSVIINSLQIACKSEIKLTETFVLKQEVAIRKAPGRYAARVEDEEAAELG